MGNRCYKGRFLDNNSARLGLKRCHGGPVVDGIKWLPCRYLERCLGMSLKKWLERAKKQ
jgi:hypothetical protein